MNRTIRFIVACILLFYPIKSFTADKLNQHTEGNQAPAVNVAPGGNLIINYGVSGELVADVVPDIKCKLNYPYKVVKGVGQKQISNPEMTITNVGPIEAVAFSADLKTYHYNKNLAIITAVSELDMEATNHFIFRKELQPADEIVSQMFGAHEKNYVTIYVVSFKYYRKADMKVFNRQDMFFIENHEILPEKDYSKNANYQQIIQAIKSYKPSTDRGRIHLQAIDDHAWLVKETPKSGLVILGTCDGGKGLTISGIPEDPRHAIKQRCTDKNRPLLYIRPSILKSMGTYLEPKIVNEDTVNIAFRYEVENIGGLEAFMISEIGAMPYPKPLKPGDKIYLESGVKVIRSGGSKQTVRDLISEITKDEFFLEHYENIHYFQESQDKEYIVKLIYKIGKSSVQLIKYELN